MADDKKKKTSEERKDEVIETQMNVIRTLTENNLRRVGADLWGEGSPAPDGTPGTETPPGTPSGKKSGTVIDPTEEIRRMTEELTKSLRRDFPSVQTPASDTPSAPPAGKKSPTVKPADKKKTEAPQPAADAEKKPEEESEAVPEREDINDLKKELDEYIGLDAVKEEVRGLINVATVYQMRRSHGLPTADLSLHMVFSGNPGTGKTMIARFMSRVYHSLGILSKGHLVETDRSGLVAGYVGQTAIKTKKVCEQAKGGVLFIDEAYSLTSKEGNDFGQESVDTILKYMEDNRDDLVVIVAGYTELMEKFINSNPGLQSRFNKYIAFADYTAEEMRGIFDLQCKKHRYEPDAEASKELDEYLAMAAQAAGEFGNARGVRNTFEKILAAQANRLGERKDVTVDELITFTRADVRMAVYGTEVLPCEEAEKPKDAPVPPADEKTADAVPPASEKPADGEKKDDVPPSAN